MTRLWCFVDYCPKIIIALGIQPTSFADWEKIDTVEQKEGERRGKPREKIVSVKEMLDIINQPPPDPTAVDH